ncbi:MAG: hypothetical protein Q9219_002972 [cf. Caloplaca sp. 3 TL-2023]
MPVPSLAELTRKELIKNISTLTDIGDVPYEVIRPVLMKIDDPEQLQLLEEASPQLYGVDQDVWISLIKRDVPDADKKMLYPKNPKSWWKVYCKMRTNHEQEVQEDALQMKAAFNGLQAARDNRQAKFMEGVPTCPKIGGMIYAHRFEHNKVKKPAKKLVLPVSTVHRSCTGTTKVLTGRGIFNKAGREARKMDQTRANSSMAIPTHQLKNHATQLCEAPRHLVEDYSKPSPPKYIDPTTPKPAMFVPPKRRVDKKVEKPSSGIMSIEERERRLRALTNPRTTTKAATTSTSPAPSAVTASTSKPATVTDNSTSTSTSHPPATPKPPSRKPLQATLLASKPALSELKSKDSPIPTIESDSSSSESSQVKTTPSPPHYKIPRLKISPESAGLRTPKKKAEVSPFMPAKRRRLS